MTPREQAAFNAGVEAMRQMAMAAAVTIEVRDDADRVRQQAAAAALHGLAEGARELMLGTKDTRQTRTLKDEAMHQAFAAIAAEPGSSGTVICPACKGRLRWGRDSTNGHLHGECEAADCLRWMESEGIPTACLARVGGANHRCEPPCR